MFGFGFVKAGVNATGDDVLPHYPTFIRDTTAYPDPFYLRIASDNANFDGHNMQYCPGKLSTVQTGGQDSGNVDTRYDGGCVDANLNSRVLSFQLRDGKLFTRKFDDNTGSYADEGMVGGLKNVTNWNDGNHNEFDAQSIAFAPPSDPGHSFDLPNDKWALEVTGDYQGIGSYQLINELWNGQFSPIQLPWVLGWMLCVLDTGSNGEAALAWFQSAQSDPIPLPDGCEVVQPQVSHVVSAQVTDEVLTSSRID